MNIVVVDDEPKICRGLQKLLAGHKNWAVPGAFGSAAEALDFLARHPVDVVICDIRMPELSGLALIRALRAAGQDTEVIILSGYSDFAYAQQAIALGVRRYLTKPTKTAELVQVLTELEDELTGKARAPQQAGAGYCNHLVDEAIGYVRLHYAGRLALKSMAEALHISPNYLCRLFKKHTGQGLTEYITQTRLHQACLLLQSGHDPVTQVAEQVGFADTKYFSLQFKKALGVTPLEYRNGKRRPEGQG